MLPYIHIFYTARRRRKTLGLFWGVKMLPYIHIFYTARLRPKKSGFFWGGSKCRHIYTFWIFFGVKMLPYIYIHILDDFLGQNATICTRFLGQKCCHIYTFLEFNFSRKNEKKRTIPQDFFLQVRSSQGKNNAVFIRCVFIYFFCFKVNKIISKLMFKTKQIT
jgi:hypothetical protein